MGKETDLIEAGRSGDVATIEKLLACRKPRKISGFAPLGFTFSSLRRAVNTNAQNSQGDTSLHLAALNGHLEAVQTLLKYDASANLMDASGCFPLHLAAWSGNSDICRTLLNQGPSLAKVNEQNAAGDTALHTAAQYGHAQTVRVLLENFADPLIRNQSAETALDLAAQYGRLDCVRLLLNSCPALADCSTKHSSALNLAARNGHKDVILALVNSGLDVNSVSGYGTSALHEAARSGKADTVALLLTHGADLTIRDGKGRTALDLVQDIPSDAAREIVRLIRLKEETKFASYPRPSLITNGSDACTNSLKFIRRPPPNKNSFSSEYAASVHSSDYSSLVDSSDGSYSPSSYSRTDRDSELQTFRVRRDPNGNTKSLNNTKEEESDYCEVQGQFEIEELEASPRRARFRIKEEQGETRRDVYATVNKERVARCNTLPKAGTQIVYNEDLYEAFDPDWSVRSRDSEDQSETVTDSALDQSEATNGSADMTDSPDVEMPESDVPPVPPKMPCIRNNNPEYLDMNGSSRKEPILTIVETSDDEYVDVEPCNVIGENDVISDAMRETDIVNGCSSTDDNLEEDEIVSVPASPSLRDRPPSLELASARPQSAPDDVTSKRCDVTDQLPTPDHPPPSPKTALRGIQMVINPKDKRRSRDMETSTDEIQFPAKTEQSAISDPPPSALPTTPESGSESESESDSESAIVAVRTSIHEPFKAVPEETEESLIKGSTPGRRRAMSAMYEDMVVRSPVKRSSLNITVGSNQQDELNSMFKEIDDIVSDLKCHKDPRNRRSGSSQDRVLSRGGDDVTMRQSDVTNGSSAGGAAGEKTRDDSHSEDWAEIADIMASFGGRITRESVFIRDFEEEFTRLITGSSRAQSVGDWLASLSLSQYENILVPNGFDDMEYMATNVLEEADLIEMGIYNELHRDTMLSSLKQLPPMKTIESLSSSQFSVEEWLRTLHLEAYLPVFVQHDYTTLDKVRRIWELELTTVLDITTLGHRKRIIASLGLSRPQHRLDNMEKVDLSTLSWTLGSEDSGVTFDMNHLTVTDDVTTDAHDVRSHSSSDVTSDLSSDVGTTSSTTSTTSTSSDKPKMTVKPVIDIIEPECSQRTEASLDVRRRTRKTSSEQSDEEDVVVRRRPRSQQANRMSYSGLELRPPQDTVQEENTGVQAWKHRPEELIKGCCYYFAQYLGSTFIRELNEESTHESIVKLKNQHDNVSKLPLITLAISYRGVKFIEARSKKVICEHEIGNIFCVRQDDEHRNFLAYITEDLTSGKHYCHVFSVKTAELAAEITLTLGEAFEVAYQVALREKSVEAEREYEDLLLQTEAQIDYALSHH